MVILVTTYGTVRRACVYGAVATYLLLNADPVGTGGDWAVLDENGFLAD